MSEHLDQGHDPLTRAERKRLLTLACTTDRAEWVLAFRTAPPQSPVARMAGEIFKYIEPFSHLLPGRIGRWVRGVGFLANLGRQFGWLAR